MSVAIPTKQRFMTAAREFTRVANESVKFAGLHGNGSYSVLKSATDALGSCVVSMLNMVVGSRYRIEVASTGALVATGVAVAADFDVSVPYYAPGNAANTLAIKVRLASGSPYYRPFDTQVSVSATPQTAFISQQLDE